MGYFKTVTDLSVSEFKTYLHQLHSLSTMLPFEDIKERLNKIGQDHLLKFWETLKTEEQIEYVKHLNLIDFDEANKLFVRAQNCLTDVQTSANIKPVPKSNQGSEERESKEKLLHYQKRGLQEISNGHVGVLLLGGGQGTRLGVPYPKGLYSLGLPSRKTLLQIQAERIKRVQKLATEQTGKCVSLPWYIMTSESTNVTTEDFLKQFNYFGLNAEDVIIFNQGVFPCFDFDGKILLSDKNQVALAPDGNGGLYRALKVNGILDDMEKRNVNYLHVYSVDNILVKVADPTFIGFCLEMNSDCCAKVVKKMGPLEAVGVVCQVDGSIQVLEYSEIKEEIAKLCDSQGNLIFNAGNICNHLFSTSFLRDVVNNYESKLKLHVVKKKVAYVDENGQTVEPTSANGIKIEKFIFDVFQFSKNFTLWEVPRQYEFSALKNNNDVGKDCPSTARRDLLSLHKFYIERAGGRVFGEEVEISPLLSYSGENLETKVVGKIFKSPFHIKADEESNEI